MQLQPGATLQGGKYKIVKVIGQGGFGITYLAEHTLLGKKIAIKEFFYKTYCNRDGSTNSVFLGTQTNADLVDKFLKKFIKEAQTISQFHHPNIVEIYDIFSENNTAYYVMEYIEGQSLNDMIKKLQRLPEETVVSFITQVADALKCIHAQHLNHLDIKPSNIMLREHDKRVILIDFGTSKQYDAQTNMAETTTTPVGYSTGFAPIEQYRQGGVSAFSPEADIYALGATMYKLLTGITPPEAIALDDEGLASLDTLSPKMRMLIQKCMRTRKSERPHSIDEFALMLSDDVKDESTYVKVDQSAQSGKATTSSVPNPSVDKTASKTHASSNKKYVYTGILAALVVFALVRLCSGHDDSTAEVQNTETKLVELSSSSGGASSGTSTTTMPAKAQKNNTGAPSQSKSPSKASPKDKPSESVNTVSDDAALLKSALSKGDYPTVQRLANQGFAPAYVPLAKYYLQNNEYDEADRYAQKARAAGQSGAQTVITTLDNLGYYDD